MLIDENVDWSKLTPNAIWHSLRNAPKIAGPWEESPVSGEMDVRRAMDGTIIATELWVTPGYPASWRCSADGRDSADDALRKNGWLLTGK